MYSLSFSTSNYPDPKYAHAVWERRANVSFFFGAAIVTALLYLLGAIHVWWVVVITFVICLVVMGFVQVTLIAAIIAVRTGSGYLKDQNGP